MRAAVGMHGSMKPAGKMRGRDSTEMARVIRTKRDQAASHSPPGRRYIRGRRERGAAKPF
jgi:hypothetical protein